MSRFSLNLATLSLSSSVSWNTGSHCFEACSESTSGHLVEPFGVGELCAEDAEVDGLKLRRECLRAADSSWLAIRLQLENASGSAIELQDLVPAEITDLKLGETPASEWTVVRQPRMKNDMPAAFRLGSTGEEVWDAVRGLAETGGAPGGGDGEAPRKIVSSELTLLAADGAALGVAVVPITDYLISSELLINDARDDVECLSVTCHGDGQVVAPGAMVVSPWVVAIVDANTEAVLQRYADYLRETTVARPSVDQKRPTVWCSWYYYGDGFRQDELEANLEYFEKTEFPSDVILIDECWDVRWGDWDPNSRWPDLPGIAERIAKAGYRPGIWTCCFLAEPRSTTRHCHPEWLLRDGNGKPIRFHMNSAENYVLDPTHPEVLEFIEALYRKLTEDWGYTYHKIDFTRSVGHPDAVFHDRTKNRAQAYRMGMEAVRRGIGEGSYLNICGGFYGPAMGFADAQRTGSDVKSEWPLHPENPALPFGPFTIKQNTLRSWMNRLWHNDGDSLMVRRREEAYREEILSQGFLTDVEAETSALNQYLGGGLVSYTENLPEIDSDRLLELSKCSPSLGVAAFPVDLRDGARFQRLFRTWLEEPGGNSMTISAVNWSNTEADIEVDLAAVGLPVDWDQVLVGDYHEAGAQLCSRDQVLTLSGVPGHACRVLKLQRLDAAQPQLVRTNGHFSMGAAEISSWDWDGSKLVVDINWPWVRPLLLTIRNVNGELVECGVGSGRQVLDLSD